MYDDLLRLIVHDRSWTISFANDVAVVAIPGTTEMLELITNVVMQRISDWMEKNGRKENL